MINRTLKCIDLFAGLGGFHLAARRLGCECVFASEIDPVLQSTYALNFGIRPVGDIQNIVPADVPRHDLLCAGFPCQPFSKAGDQMGWMDAVRGTVFFNLVEILRAKRPKYVLLENVAHFVRHDEGNTYARVKAALESLGYAVMSATLSPHWFGVPQIRERMYLVGRLGGLEGFKWPATTTRGKELSVRDILDNNPSGAKCLSPQVTSCLEAWQEFLDILPPSTKLPSFPMWSMETGATYPYECDSLERIALPTLRLKRGCFGTTLNTRLRADILQRVPSYARGSKDVFPRWKQGFIRQNRDFFGHHSKRLNSWTHKIRRFPPSLQKFEWNCQGGKRSVWEYVIQFRASGVRIKRPTTSPSLVAMTTTQVPIVGWERRYMTVRECARLQSMDELRVLPDGEAAMEALGNAVNVRVATAVMESLLRLA